MDPGNGAAHVFKVGRFLSGLTKSHVPRWTAVIASHCHNVSFFLFVGWLQRMIVFVTCNIEYSNYE
jgi:hypothetical protein